MNPHNTCGTCIHNDGNRCACEDSLYKDSPVKSWNTCSQQKSPVPTTAELIERLAACAAGLEWRTEKAEGEYKAYFDDRARQCRKWLWDLNAGYPVDAEYIAGGLEEFEQLAL